MKYFTLLIVSVVLSVSAQAEQSPWPLMPEVAQQLQQSSAEDLHVGSFYFYYLSEDYQGAYNYLIQLRNKQQVNNSTLDILETTLLLALGLEDKAYQLFKTIEQQRASVPAIGWLYLARRWQALGNWEQAEKVARVAYNNKTQPLEFQEAQEALYILVHCSVELEDIRSATNYFKMMEERGKWTELSRHNLLFASIEGYASVYEVKRQIEAAAYFFDDSEESLALKDRMFLLGAVYMLREGQFREAEILLRRVRQDSPYAAPALLEYGWAKLEQSRYEEALQPWRVLQTKYESWHPAVVESILAIPHTMEMMNATTQALHGYETVEKRLLKMLTELEGQQQASAINDWLDDWLVQQQGDWGWRRHDSIIDQTKPMNHRLMSLLASSSVRAQMDELYDLKRMQQDLNNQLQQLTYWQQTIDSRQRYLGSVNGGHRLAALEERYKRLMPAVESLENQWQLGKESPTAYTDVAQQQQVQSIQRIVPLIKGLQESAADDPNLKGYMERWRRARGVLVWQISEQRPQREWQATREIRQLRQQVTLLNTQLNHSQLALNNSAAGWQGFAARIEQAQQKAQTAQNNINELTQRQQQQIVAIVQADLQQQQVKLTHYLAQARLALARLYDDHLQHNIATATFGGEK